MQHCYYPWVRPDELSACGQCSPAQAPVRVRSQGPNASEIEQTEGTVQYMVSLGANILLAPCLAAVSPQAARGGSLNWTEDGHQTEGTNAILAAEMQDQRDCPGSFNLSLSLSPSSGLTAAWDQTDSRTTESHVNTKEPTKHHGAIGTGPNMRAWGLINMAARYTGCRWAQGPEVVWGNRRCSPAAPARAPD